MSEEIAEEGARYGQETTEAQQVRDWIPVPKQAKKTLRRLMEITGWIEGQHRMVESEEIIAYAMRHYRVQRETAQAYLKTIIERFEKRGIPVRYT